MGEKFAANPVTGSGSMSVPIATSPGRSGFGPQLSLSYDSGAGNGPFGFGWTLALPAITRKTDKGLPRFRDWSTDPQEEDVIVLSGSEDLVPVLRQGTAGLEIHEDLIDGYRVRRYRPRIEGLFARIERWQWIPSSSDSRPEAEQCADVHWRSISKDNILTIYGADASSRIADPEDLQRIFSWLICESRDDKGNGIRYLYKAENGTATLRSGQDDPFRAAHQRNRGARNAPSRTAQRYLQRILYGNRRPLLDPQGQRPWRLANLPQAPSDTGSDWLFEVRFDYGELNTDDPSGTGEQHWFYRPDAFSSYRSGFEVRTCRRCERVLMLHHIPDQAATADRPLLKGYEGVVRSTEFVYDDEIAPTIASKPVYSFISQVVQRGWTQENGTPTTKKLPPLLFRYSQPILGEGVELLDPASLENLPIGLDGSSYRWVDLHGEGLPGILTEQAGAWFYKRNLSPVSQRLRADAQADVATFAALETVASQPNASLAAGAQILDLAGDGLPDVVTFSGPLPGLYEHDDAESWQPWRAFRQLPNVDFSDPNLRFIDLDGDGHADLLISEGDVFVWHRSLEEQGFEAAQRLPLPWDEEKGPRVVFADGTESIHLADMSGDGQADVVRIRAGVHGREICYWPNLGYGRFGAKVSMDNPPLFDHPELFDPKRLLLADIDGSGSTDLIYLHAEGVRLYFNQAGNGWSAAVPLKVFPPIHSGAQVTTVDLVGNGTACLVWSSPLAGDSGRQMRYVKLMAEGKPHLLITSINNLGAETRVQYCSSLRFYLEDKLNGKPWITRLPFSVHVVERVETIDHISRNRFVSRHAYHHGFFDGEEREFRGFGMVEQWDTERLDAVAGQTNAASGFLNEEAAHTQPPVHTKTWFHTGVYLGQERVSRQYASEYYREPGLTPEQIADQLLPHTLLPEGLSVAEEREACRAFKGMMLRQEVYTDEADHPGATAAEMERARTPYTVSEQNFSIRVLQPQGRNRHAVFFSHPREALTYHYERNPADPRVQHALTLEVDAYGNVRKQAAVGYGRRSSPLTEDWDQKRQTTTLITYSENRFTNAIEATDQHRTPLPCEAITYELTGYTSSGLAGRYQPGDFVEPNPASPGTLQQRFNAPEVAYEATASGTRRRRPIEHLRTLYRPNDMGTAAGNTNQLLLLGQQESLALPGESYKLAFTPGLLEQVYQRSPGANQPAQALLPSADRATVLGGLGGDQGGYVDLGGNGHWWLPSGRSFFSSGQADPPATELAQARGHFFLPRRIRDPFGKSALVDHDALDLLMAETRDPLDNRITVEANEYRVLQPQLVSDPNRNRSEVAFDVLGMVVGTAVMGKAAPAPVEGDSLSGFMPDPNQSELDAFFSAPVEASPADPKRSQATNATRNLLADATSRIVYDLDRFWVTQAANPGDPSKWQPALAATIARETHFSDENGTPSRLQVSFSYSDGFGREIQKKIQAEPGRLDPLDNTSAQLNPRWVGSGWTVFNNKGKPVRQYEPFFSATQGFEFGVIQGVSPVLFYDPADRVVATLHPNHTWEKVVFDPWQQTTWDVNDTVARFDLASRTASVLDPSADPDVGGFFQKLPSESYAPSWYELRTDPAKALVQWPDVDAQGNPLAGNANRRASEKKAAERAAAHADTPTTAHFDALGRPFLTGAGNRVVCAGHALDGTEESFATRVELDIEGNQRAVRDAITHTEALDASGNPVVVDDPLGRIVMRYAYDMLGNHIHQLSMEAGARWMLNDVAGKPIRAWDSRGHSFSTTYDALRRPLHQYVHGTSAESDPRTRNPANPEGLLVDKIDYGEALPNAEELNLRTRIYRHSDSAGIATNARLDAGGTPLLAYDFKGNLLSSCRQLISRYKEIPDWGVNPHPQLDAEIFEGSTRYDALNRASQSVAPHSSLTRPGHPIRINVIQPVFNEANLLERLDVWLERAAEPTSLLDPAGEVPSPVGVADIDYDAKGQRQWIDYKNGASTVYSYDPLTFRLTQLQTSRRSTEFPGDDPQQPDPAWPGRYVQNLHYTYDPAGNITHIQDDAQQIIFFANQRIEPSNDYTYDALYRLIQASGREHLGQNANQQKNPPTAPDAFNAFHTRLDHPGNGQAMGTYIERYVYDAVGNFLQMQHRGSDPTHQGWTRAYDYLETSFIEARTDTALKTSNRLTRTTLNREGTTPQPEIYGHDAHGNMTRMAHLPQMLWDYRDQLLATARQVVNNGGTPETTYYVYDASGQRIRKVTERQSNAPDAATKKEERLYLGGFEIYREYEADGSTLELERETLHVLDDKQRVALVEKRTFRKTSDPGDPLLLIRYQFGNHLGSASLELDEQAQIISYEEYSPYGSSTYQAVRSQTETPKRYRNTGKERDEESGLYYHGARYYAAWLGRWTAPDPGGLRDGSNLFVYVSNDPVGKLDPNGKWKVSWTDVAIGAVGAALVVGVVVVTAGLAAPAAAAALTAVGVSEATIAAVGTTAVAVGTAAGVVGTGNTAAEVVTGRTATGRTLTDAERSRRLGALPVEAVATALGVRALTGGGGGGSLPFPGRGGAAAREAAPATVAVSSPPAAAGLASVSPSILMSAMTGEGGGSSSSTPPEPTSSSSQPVPESMSSEPVPESLASEPLSSEPPVSEGTYRSQGGHHVHQSASYSQGGPSETGNPNHADAVTVALEGHSTDLSSQHGRATAVQRLLNRAVRGRFSGEAEVGPVSIEVSGEGNLPPTPNQSFEDVKAFYSMSAADAPGYQSGEDVLGLVCRSADQLLSSPVRVPSR
jgi:RHS repeat-associated protein